MNNDNGRFQRLPEGLPGGNYARGAGRFEGHERLASSMLLTYNYVPVAAIAELIRQLKEFGSRVSITSHADWHAAWDDKLITGTIDHDSGQLIFVYDATLERLSITLVKESGHFPRLLLIGGIRQLVYEAVEVVNCRTQVPAPATAS